MRKEETNSGLRRKDFRVKGKNFTEKWLKVEEFSGQKSLRWKPIQGRLKKVEDL